MERRRNQYVWPITAIIVTAIVAVAGRSGGEPTVAPLHEGAANPPRPSVVVTADLEKVFEALDLRAREDAELTAMAEALQARTDSLAADLTALEEELDAYVEGSDKHQATQEKFKLAAYDYQAEVEFARRKLDLHRALVLGRIYKAIKEAAEVLAIENGYDVVFVDDSIEQVPPGTEADVRRQISSRRVLYRNPEIDITHQLIHHMNQP